jgi:hypothetical protein
MARIHIIALQDLHSADGLPWDILTSINVPQILKIRDLILFVRIFTGNFLRRPRDIFYPLNVQSAMFHLKTFSKSTVHSLH